LYLPPSPTFYVEAERLAKYAAEFHELDPADAVYQIVAGALCRAALETHARLHGEPSDREQQRLYFSTRDRANLYLHNSPAAPRHDVATIILTTTRFVAGGVQ
jgi:hypothetical protein